MVVLYTRNGDGGSTYIGQTQFFKDSQLVHTLGLLDSLMCDIEYFNIILDNNGGYTPLQNYLKMLLRNLRFIGAELYDDKYVSSSVDRDDIMELEKNIDRANIKETEFQHFFDVVSNSANRCRVSSRALERSFVSLYNNDQCRKLLVMYVNRLSDYFYSVAFALRVENDSNFDKKHGNWKQWFGLGRR